MRTPLISIVLFVIAAFFGAAGQFCTNPGLTGRPN